jgi:aspartate-semialdehyde dehydrogenase
MGRQRGIRIALVGTDTFRGKEIKDVLDERKFSFEKIDFYDSDVKEEFSKLTEFRGEPRVILPVDESVLADSDVECLAADKKTCLELGHLAANSNFLAVDLSETFNEDQCVPLVVAGVNHDLLRKKRPPLVANPHPVTIILSHLFHVLLKRYKIINAVAFVLQPVSAFGDSGIRELADQSFAVLRGGSVSKNIFKTQIAFNLLSHTGVMDKNGFSSSEKQIVAEISRIFGEKDFSVSLSIIQAPVFHTYSVMIHLELEQKPAIKTIQNLFEKSFYFRVFPPSASCPVSSVLVAGKDEIFIGQIKKEEAHPNRFWIWTVTDNLTRGSALNAIEILENSSLFIPGKK